LDLSGRNRSLEKLASLRFFIILTVYQLLTDHKFKENEIGRACSTHEGDAYRSLEPKEGTIKRKWSPNKCDVDWIRLALDDSDGLF
jgi:hypothetical protein